VPVFIVQVLRCKYYEIETELLKNYNIYYKVVSGLKNIYNLYEYVLVPTNTLRALKAGI